MKILFYFGHPAQYLFLRETIRQIKLSGNIEINIVIKTKDVLEDLVKEDGHSYTNILPRERKKSKLSIFLSLLKRNLRLIPIVIRTKPGLLIGTDASVAQAGRLLGGKTITITEDDYPVIRSLANLTYPFTSTILCPEVCQVGKWEHKKVGYKGYMKLAYLHPNVFKPDRQILNKYKIKGKYVLIRLAKLTAHHDFGVKGIDLDMLDKSISLLNNKGYRVFISSEKHLHQKYQSFLLQINPVDMHHILAFSNLLISDSQSMSVEAAMLGIPSLRLSDFAGRISVLEELEHVYKLTFGIKPDNKDLFFKKLNELADMQEIETEFQSRRRVMLKDKIDVSAFLTWFIKNYPKSVLTLNENPDYQDRFK